MWSRRNDYAFRRKVDQLVVNVAAVCHASIPRDVIETSVARLGFCIQFFTLIFFFRVKGNCWGRGVVMTFIEKFEILKIFILNLAAFFCVFELSISSFS